MFKLHIMAENNYKHNLRMVIRETVTKMMDEMPGDGYIQERPLTPAEEKKKEELVKALKPKYGKTPKTYAIATAKAKKLAEEEDFVFNFDKEDENESDKSKKEGEILEPNFGINASSKFLAIVYKDGEVDDNKYFDSKDEAQAWIDECCENDLEERMLAFPDKTKAPGRNKEHLPYHSPVSQTLDEMEMEEEVEFSDKYDDNPELKGHQSQLPDNLQKAIINKKNKK